MPGCRDQPIFVLQRREKQVLHLIRNRFFIARAGRRASQKKRELSLGRAHIYISPM